MVLAQKDTKILPPTHELVIANSRCNSKQQMYINNIPDSYIMTNGYHFLITVQIETPGVNMPIKWNISTTWSSLEPQATLMAAR